MRAHQILISTHKRPSRKVCGRCGLDHDKERGLKLRQQPIEYRRAPERSCPCRK